MPLGTLDHSVTRRPEPLLFLQNDFFLDFDAYAVAF
jgi:hypothetical protein